MKILRTIVFGLALSLTANTGFAVEPDEILKDPVLEARARSISAEVRCVVCQNESIDTSNAGIARDLRILLRERLVAGDSDEQVFDFLVARYGDFVLLKPPFKMSTYVLWLTPMLIFAAGGMGIMLMLRQVRRRSAHAEESLDAEEEAELRRLLNIEQEEPIT